jgi:hypothetical protein
VGVSAPDVPLPFAAGGGLKVNVVELDKPFWFCEAVDLETELLNADLPSTDSR